MNPATLLRLASGLAALQFCAHTLQFLRATPKHGAEEIAVVETMKAHFFNFGGSTRSYWNFYYGYGLLAAFSVFLEVVLFWQLATLATTRMSGVRPIVALFIFSNLVHAALCTKYFFRAPIIADLVIAACLAAAFFAARPGHA